ncbi:MAG: hypothetical protein ACJ73E_17385 [Mycobacteriales bacterium]
MNFSPSEETATLAVLVRQHATAGSDLRIDRLDGWQNPQASTSKLTFCYTAAAPIPDHRA